MSLGIVFKGPEGIVLAADSRVTLNVETLPVDGKIRVLSSAYDNAIKLLRVNKQTHVGAVTYGLGALGQAEPRTAHSFIPEFESTLLDKYGENRLSVEAFAKELSDFFMAQWHARMPKDYNGEPMIFLIGGYDKDAPYGRVFQIALPNAPQPVEQNAGQGAFGVTWGGQLEFATRLLNGFDPRLTTIVQQELKISDDQISDLNGKLTNQLSLPIPYQFLPLQDCIDLSIFLIKTTIELQKWSIGIRGVGGAIDVATITRTDGFTDIQRKKIRGDK
jgi:hypothetical protein